MGRTVLTTVPEALCPVLYLHKLTTYQKPHQPQSPQPQFQDINSSCPSASRPVVLNQGRCCA